MSTSVSHLNTLFACLFHLYYKDQDREAMRGWYGKHQHHLPPGLAKKDQLPPGLENSSSGAALFLPVSRSGCNPAQRISNGRYPRLLGIARTCSLEGISFY